VPAIVPRALFDKVQDKLTWNRQVHRNPRRLQLLSSLITCEVDPRNANAAYRLFRSEFVI